MGRRVVPPRPAAPDRLPDELRRLVNDRGDFYAGGFFDDYRDNGRRAEYHRYRELKAAFLDEHDLTLTDFAEICSQRQPT